MLVGAPGPTPALALRRPATGPGVRCPPRARRGPVRQWVSLPGGARSAGRTAAARCSRAWCCGARARSGAPVCRSRPARCDRRADLLWGVGRQGSRGVDARAKRNTPDPHPPNFTQSTRSTQRGLRRSGAAGSAGLFTDLDHCYLCVLMQYTASSPPPAPLLPEPLVSTIRAVRWRSARSPPSAWADRS